MSRKLVRLCDHEELYRHPFGEYWNRSICPGGEFLADDALVIDPKNHEQVAEALVVLDALMVSFYDQHRDGAG